MAADRYVQGDTVWLRGSFYNRSGVLYDPTPGTITLKIYDMGRVQIGTTITGASITKLSTGVYEAAYVLPAGRTQIIYEWSGTDSSANVHLNRAIIEPIYASV